MNSFRSVERAIEYEIARQEAALRAGEPLIQETRGWDDDRGLTYHMRTKETSDDYRYFPEPDLPPLRARPGLARGDPGGAAGAAGRAPCALPRRAGAVRLRRRRARSPTPGPRPSSRPLARPIPGLPAKKLANWVSGEYLRLAKGEDAVGWHRRVSAARSWPRWCGSSRTDRSAAPTPRRSCFVSGAAAGRWPRSWPRPASSRSATRGALQAAVDEVIAENPDAVADVRAGDAESHRLPDRPGHEEDARSGQRRAGATADPRTAGGRLSDVDILGLVLIVGGIAAIAVGALQVRGPLATIRQPRRDRGQPRALRDVAWQADRRGGRRSHRRRRDARADASAPHALGRRHRRRRRLDRVGLRRLTRGPARPRAAAVGRACDAVGRGVSLAGPARSIAAPGQAAAASGRPGSVRPWAIGVRSLGATGSVGMRAIHRSRRRGRPPGLASEVLAARRWRRCTSTRGRRPRRPWSRW